MTLRPLPLLGQLIAYAAVMAFIGNFSAAPAYSPFDPDLAQIKVSFRHGGAPKVECRRLTPEEIAKLAPNMRKSLDCPRERVPVQVEVTLDGQSLYAASVAPTGIWRDGPSKVYATFAVAPGRHTLAARLRDDVQGRTNAGAAKEARLAPASGGTDEWQYQRAAEIELAARQVLVVEFRADRGGFLFE